MKFVTALIQNTKGDGKSSDPFWEKAEQLLYQALIGYIHFEAPPHEQNMNSLVEMINKMEVREDNENFKKSIDYLFEALEERAPQHFAVRQYKKYKLAAGVVSYKRLIHQTCVQLMRKPCIAYFISIPKGENHHERTQNHRLV